MHISPQDHERLTTLLRQHLPDTEVWAFGSRVCGQPRPSSDLDLVAFSDDADRLFLAREALDASELPFRVDLLQWSALPENMRSQIRHCHEVLIRADRWHGQNTPGKP